MQNFKVFDNCNLDFDKGIGVFTGENGNGKSSIFEAIEFSLFGTIKRKGRVFGSSYAPLTDLIQTKKSTMNTELIFNSPVNKKDYRVMRNIDKNGKRKDALFLGPTVVCEGTTPVNAEIIKLLGLRHEAFSAISYVRQGEISELTRKATGEREKIVDRILNLEIFEKAREIVNKDKTEIQKNQNKIVSKIEQIEQEKAEDKEKIEKDGEELKRLKRHFKIADEKYKKMKSEKALFEKLKNLQTKIDGYENTLKSEGKKREHAVGEKKEEIKGIQADIRHGINSLTEKIDNTKKLYTEKLKSLHAEKLADIEKVKFHTPTSVIVIFLLLLVITAILLALNIILALIVFIAGILFDIYKLKTARSDKGASAEIARKYDRQIKTMEQERDKDINEFTKQKASKEKTFADIIKKHEIDLKSVSQSENKSISGIKKKIGSMKKQEKTLEIKIESEDVKEEFKNAEKERERLTKSLKEIEGSIKTLKNKVKGYEENLKKLNKDDDEYRKRIEKLNILGEEILKRIPKWVRLRLIAVVREETKNLFLKMFGHRYKDIEITSDYNIEVLSPFANEFYPVSMISGGEDTAANIALRLGISKALNNVYKEVRGQSAAPGLLIMDEPTTHLDRKRREVLNEVIKAIHDLPQVLISTNIEEVENAADYIVSVNRESSIRPSKVAVFKTKKSI